MRFGGGIDGRGGRRGDHTVGRGQELQTVPAHADVFALLHGGLGDPAAVQIRTVVAAEIPDTESLGAAHDLGVVLGYGFVLQPDVAVMVPADENAIGRDVDDPTVFRRPIDLKNDHTCDSNVGDPLKATPIRRWPGGVPLWQVLREA